MALARRLPKRGFTSMTRDDTVEIRLSDLNKIEGNEVDLLVLNQGYARCDTVAEGSEVEVLAKEFSSSSVDLEVTWWASPPTTTPEPR